MARLQHGARRDEDKPGSSLRPSSRPPSRRLHRVPPGILFAIGWLQTWTTPNLHRYTPLCMLGANTCACVTLAIAVNALGEHGPSPLGVGARQPVPSFVLFVLNDVVVLACWTTILLLWSALSVTGQWQLLSPVNAIYVYLPIGPIYMVMFRGVDGVYVIA